VLRIGPPQPLASVVYDGADASIDGRIRAIPQGDHALVLDRERPQRHILLRPQYNIRFCGVSPDGRWIATSNWWTDGKTAGVRIWDAATGRHVADLPVEVPCSASFSPNRRWLITRTVGKYCELWECGTWRAQMRIPGSAACWNADGKMLVVNDLG